MAVSAKLYTNAMKAFMMGAVTWKASGGSVIKVALLTSTYTPDQDAHDNFDDVSAYEVTGTGYTAGGKALTLSDPTVDAATNETRMDADDVQWTDSTITARYAVVYYASGTPSTSTLIAYVDFGEDVSSSGAAFDIAWAASGIFKVTVA
jgi:hypothetical protein